MTKTTTTTSTEGGKVTDIVDKLNNNYYRDSKKNETKSTNEKKASDYEEDRIETIQDVYYWLDQDALVDVGECQSIKEVEDALSMYGYDNFFDRLELKIIWDAGQALVDKFYELKY